MKNIIRGLIITISFTLQTLVLFGQKHDRKRESFIKSFKTKIFLLPVIQEQIKGVYFFNGNERPYQDAVIDEFGNIGINLGLKDKPVHCFR